MQACTNNLEYPDPYQYPARPPPPASRPLRHRPPLAQVLGGAGRVGSIEWLGINATRRIDITVLSLEAVNC